MSEEIKEQYIRLAESVDKAHGSMDAVIDLPVGPTIETRVAGLVSRHKQALAKIEYLKTEFQKLAAYVLEEQEERHRAQRIIGGLMMQLDAANRKKAADKLLN